MSTGPTLIATPAPAHGLTDDIQSLFNGAQKGHLHFDVPVPAVVALSANPSPAVPTPPSPGVNGLMVPEEERLFVAQLAHLASQHHLSEYNRSKYGPSGAQFPYMPLSIQFPAQYKDMQARQVYNSERQAWWPCQARSNSSMPIASTSTIITVGDKTTPSPMSELSSNTVLLADPPTSALIISERARPALVAPPAVDIEEEILAAIAEPIPRHAYPLQLKTSETHPINVSSLIPPELLSVISDHLTPSPGPTLFNVPPPCFLDHVIPPPPSVRLMHVHASLMSAPPIPNSPPVVSLAMGLVPNGIHPLNTGRPPPFQSESSTRHGSFVPSLTPSWTRTSLLNPFGLSRVASPAVLPTNPAPVLPPKLLPPKLTRTASSESSKKTSLRSSRKPIAPTFERAISAPPGPLSTNRVFKMSERLLRRPTDAESSLGNRMDADGRGTKRDDVLHSHGQSPYARPSEGLSSSPRSPRRSPPSAFARPTERLPSLSPLPSPVGSREKTPPLLGNLLLSSCPGKKVRLSGPVKGRGAVCRDLGRDLCRIRDMGVGCVVCCLDDDELDFLGASWSEYSAVARDIGLDVLRLPTPEGLGLLSTATLDGHLSRLIESYTLKGTPILVHCRGGVGRAGLVAACWALKLGLCGWLEPLSPQDQDDRSPPFPAPGEPNGRGLAVPEATVRLVSRAIQVVRHRRNIKAIETYEQVRFLVAYVEHLANGVDTRIPALDICGID